MIELHRVIRGDSFTDAIQYRVIYLNPLSVTLIEPTIHETRIWVDGQPSVILVEETPEQIRLLVDPHLNAWRDIDPMTKMADDLSAMNKSELVGTVLMLRTRIESLDNALFEERMGEDL